MEKPTILLVDDHTVNLTMLNELLSPHYAIRACKSGEAALRNIAIEPIPDLILLDILMPGMDGYETLEQMKQRPIGKEIPVIFISGLDSSLDEEKGFQLGAVDYITKPFISAIVLKRVKVHLDLKKARDQLVSQNEWLEQEVARRVRENTIIQDITLSMISQLAETRDADTAHHITRTQAYMKILAERMKTVPQYASLLHEKHIRRMVKAAPLHDIGKIGIPDHILLKPGKLTEQEFETMKQHVIIGGDAIRNAIKQVMEVNDLVREEFKPLSLLFLEEAETIARFHHEKWDGTGYPLGLKGEEIPLAARLMALADVFDAVTTPRVYKSIWTMRQASEMIIGQKGKHFDPEVVEAFQMEQESFEKVLREITDEE